MAFSFWLPPNMYNSELLFYIINAYVKMPAQKKWQQKSHIRKNSAAYINYLLLYCDIGFTAQGKSAEKEIVQ